MASRTLEMLNNEPLNTPKDYDGVMFQVILQDGIRQWSRVGGVDSNADVEANTAAILTKVDQDIYDSYISKASTDLERLALQTSLQAQIDSKPDLSIVSILPLDSWPREITWSDGNKSPFEEPVVPSEQSPEVLETWFPDGNVDETTAGVWSVERMKQFVTLTQQELNIQGSENVQLMAFRRHSVNDTTTLDLATVATVGSYAMTWNVDSNIKTWYRSDGGKWVAEEKPKGVGSGIYLLESIVRNDPISNTVIDLGTEYHLTDGTVDHIILVFVATGGGNNTDGNGTVRIDGVMFAEASAGGGQVREDTFAGGYILIDQIDPPNGKFRIGDSGQNVILKRIKIYGPA